jgi:hypothetical protein
VLQQRPSAIRDYGCKKIAGFPARESPCQPQNREPRSLAADRRNMEGGRGTGLLGDFTRRRVNGPAPGQLDGSGGPRFSSDGPRFASYTQPAAHNGTRIPDSRFPIWGASAPFAGHATASAPRDSCKRAYGTADRAVRAGGRGLRPKPVPDQKPVSKREPGLAARHMARCEQKANRTEGRGPAIGHRDTRAGPTF